MKTVKACFNFCCLCGLALPLAVIAGTRDDIEELQIGQQEIQARLNQIEAGVQNKGLLEMAQTLERIQIELRELRGQIEQQGYDLEGIKKRQRELYLDIDRRINDMQLHGSMNTSASQSSLSDMADVAPVASAGQATTETDQEREDYKSAFESLKEARYNQAIEAFTVFLKKYPKGKYADNAQYWLGEANYVSRNFDKALQEFGKVLDQYPRSAKVPDAKLKIGYTYYELKQWDKARQVLAGIVSAHASSSVAPLAEQRLQRMSQEGH
ncbi:MAG: tol-pal system protein YbgF [Gammaproteobacteria bacterium]|nr:tol-pal system protein YbgF [Gammaproteobacteria bacterium]